MARKPRYDPGDPSLPDVGDAVVITDELHPDSNNTDTIVVSDTRGIVIGMGWLPDGEPGYSVDVPDDAGEAMNITVFARAHQLRKADAA